MPYQETRDNGKGKVRDDAESAICVAKSNDEVVRDASAGIRFVPEVVYWLALENNDEEEGATSNNRSEHREVEDPRVDTLYADPKEEESNG